MHLDDMEVTTFLPQRIAHGRTDFARRFPPARQRGKRKTYAGSMLLKIGFCLGVFAAAALVQRFVLEDRAEQNAVLEASVEDTEQGADAPEETLGRLRFVESGSVRSVFAVSQRWNMPIAEESARLIADDTMLEIVGKAGEVVSVAAAGEVRAISYDTTYGNSIRVHHGGDLESVYYNVNDIRVEEGQPLLAQDALGTVGDTGILYVAITASGAPQTPSAYLEVPETCNLS